MWMQISWLRKNTELDIQCLQNRMHLDSAGQWLSMGLLNLYLLIVYMQISNHSEASRSESALLFM